MGEWGFLGTLFDNLQTQSPMLGRFWIILMLVFRIVILGTVASDMFQDEQEEFSCNTLQPGCKQVCYDMAFPISQYRFWVFHIVLIATPSVLYLLYATHLQKKRTSQPKLGHTKIQEHKEELCLKKMYIVTVIFRIMAEVGFLLTQWWLYGFKVEAQFPCSRFPCPYTVDCFTSRPAEKTIFLWFYFGVGVISAISSFAELFYSSMKWFCCSPGPLDLERCTCEKLQNFRQDKSEEKLEGKMTSDNAASSVRLKRGPVRSSRKVTSIKGKRGKYVSTRTFMV